MWAEQYLMEFNASPGDLMELSALFLDDARVAEAAAVAQKLRKCGYIFWWKFADLIWGMRKR